MPRLSSQQSNSILNTEILIDNINCIGGETVNFTARIIDENGNNVNGGKIVFKVSGKTLKDNANKVIYAEVHNGRANLTYTTLLGWISSSNLTTSYIIECVYSVYH